MPVELDRTAQHANWFLEGGGELGALMRDFDWTTSPLGTPDQWPQSLRGAVSLMLSSKAQIVIFWGREFITLYNDAYRSVLGAKHPRVLGQPGSEAWKEIWELGLRDFFEGVVRNGEAFWAKDRLFILERNGFLEETYFDVSYDPMREESGDFGGVFCIVTETSARVVGERRIKTLRDLAERNAIARSAEEACSLSMQSFTNNSADLPFVLLYLSDADGEEPRLVSASAHTELMADAAHWPLRDVLKANELRVVSIDMALVPPDAWRTPPQDTAVGAWDLPPQQAAVIPIARSGASGPAGFIVAGLNPYRPYDEDYRGFLELVVRQVAAGIANGEAYEAERRRAEALAEIDQAKTVFFSNVSHEFRTPLTLMLAPLADTLNSAADLTPEDRHRLEVVHRNSLRLLKLVNTLLDFSRIEAGRIDSSFEPTNLAQYTTELASMFSSVMERAGLSYVIQTEDLGDVAYIDRQMWEKIVFNLVSNAFKFTFQGTIEVRLRREGSQAVLTITDSGTGIPTDAMPHLFERFYRVKGAQGRTFEGSGIGLALVHELAKLHGGNVEVESDVGRGSRFTVRLPLGTSHLPAERIGAARSLTPTSTSAVAYVQELLSWMPDSSSANPNDAPPRGEMAEVAAPHARILLADDNADMREYIRRLLSTSYEVEAVNDGESALRAARARKPDLVLTDVMMPGMDGFELLRHLRADEQLKTVPVVVLSARAGDEARVEGVSAAADDYVIKPFSARELLARVASRLQLSRLQEHARGEIAASELRYRTIFQTAGVGIWEEDFSAVKEALDELSRRGVRDFRRYFEEHPEFVRQAIGLVRVVDVNDAALDIFKASSKTELLESLERVFLPETEKAFAEELIAITEGRTIFAGEAAARTLTNDRLELMFTMAFPPNDQSLRSVLVTLMDVTERNRAERAVREDARTLETLNRVSRALASEMNLERIMQTVTDGAREVSGAKFAAFFRNVTNEAGERLMLYTLSGAPREAFEKFGMPRNTAIFAPTFAGDGPVRMDDVTMDARYGHNAPHRGMPEGDLPVRSYLAVPVKSRWGEVIGGLFLGHPEPGVFSARSERLVSGIATQAAVAIDNARLYDQSLQLISKLQESDRHKNEFLATLSHELRNPLAPLRNSLHLLRIAGSDNGSAAPIHQMMERQVNHLVRLVDDLLEISRINRGTFALRRERVELAAVVNNAIETSDPLIRAAGHKLTVALPMESLWIDGDPVRLAQILANVLNNAAKYTEAGGNIKVAARRVGDAAEIQINDNGSGISAEAMPHLFEMFSRGDRANRADHTGLGIGLALARRLVEMHGGNISARSEGLGKGSEFLVRLPLSSDQRTVGASPNRVETGVPRTRILVVDDNHDSAESMRLLLEFLGGDVCVAYDGPSAIAEFEKFEPAVVLLDIGMPGMDGYEVARRLRRTHPDRHAMIVALTGWGQDEDRRKAREAGFDRHLIKPADVDALQALLTSAAAQRH